MGPFVLLLIGGIAVTAVIRTKNKQPDAAGNGAAGEDW
jgi:hypothetical protein